MKKITDMDTPLSLMDHLEELRNRILVSLVLIIICTALVYNFTTQIMDILVSSVGKLYFMGPAEAFWVKVKLAFFIGLYCALPFLFYQIWKFVELGLRRDEKKQVLPLTIFSFLLFTIGASFCYFFVIPVAIKFLLSYGSETLIPLISVSKYLSFIGCLVFAFGSTFQLPLVLMFMARIGIVNVKSLCQFRRFAILGSFIVGAALTPTPDMVNQTLLALPIIVLYELSILLIRIFERKG
ncbi:MAG: twin-arginine translocase subunit TatC [Candidatus Omnitrophica bacterium]|nr:twin-arginine translocase subunit TatC [Candidatus Omnitrophota bacterium]